MNQFNKALAAAPPRCPRTNVQPAPSLRVPVTVANRELLRWLRAAELSAWQNADARPHRAFRLRLSCFDRGPLFRLNIART